MGADLTQVQANGQKAMDKQAKNALRSVRRPRRLKIDKATANKKVERTSATTGPSENLGSLAQGEGQETAEGEARGESMSSTTRVRPHYANVGSSPNFNNSV